MKHGKKIHGSTLILIIALMLFISSIPTPVNVISHVSAGQYGDIVPESYEFQLLNKINENRSVNGASHLKLNSTLWWVARAHSQDMIDNDFFDHSSSQQGPFHGATFQERVNDYAGYQPAYIGECIAAKSSGIDVEWCMSAWKNSPPHWDIIINPNLKEAGIGIIVGEWDGYPNSALYTADFGGTPLSVDLATDNNGISFHPENPNQGDIVNISVTVKNSGYSDAYPVSVKFYDGDPLSGGELIEEMIIPHILVHGEGTEVSINWNTQGESGLHDIYLVIDEENIITETDENNNVISDSLFINSQGGPNHLTFGWNLVSFPNIVSNEDMGSVLSSINGKYDAVQYYDPYDQNIPWKNHITQKPNDLNDLYSLNNKMGFFIHITEFNGADLLVSGSEPSSTAISLKAGWNLVGYPSRTARIRNNALNNLEFGTDVLSVQQYDEQGGTLKDLGISEKMDSGNGYFLYANSDCEWIVNN